ncbi:MAG: histidine kinase [Bacteroidales bacterium]|jgi:sensor histidine kinase YesM|nr:histidine kinase [Bacteroidales bacterium]
MIKSEKIRAYLKERSYDAVVTPLFWLSAFAFIVYFFGKHNQDYVNTIIFTLFIMPIAYLTTLILNKYIIPRYLLTKRYLRFFVMLFYLIVVSLWLVTIVVLVLLLLFWNYSFTGIDPSNFEARFLITGLYFVVLAATAVKQFQRIIKFQRIREVEAIRRAETEIRLKDAELQLLKAQINPHFLFNSLNSIYGLSLEKSEHTPEVIMLMSDILDYTLYRCNSEKVTLTDELNLIQNYINIQQYRFGNLLNVDTNLKSINTDGRYIAPLLLLPIVENAFKHSYRAEDSISTITIQAHLGNEFLFIVSNPYSSITNNNRSGGIGIENLKRRLELIYKDGYRLNIDDKNSVYRVELLLKQL